MFPAESGRFEVTLTGGRERVLLRTSTQESRPRRVLEEKAKNEGA